MKFLKRSSGEAEQAPQEEQKNSGGRKPVIIYIMILFIVAFILMAVSFVMHQRSNSEAVGKLQDSVSALQEVQSAEDKNVKLQEQLDKLEEEKSDLQDQLDSSNEEKQSESQKADALLSLYTLQQQYLAQDYTACKETISAMEDDGLDKLLPADAQGSITSPAQRYLQLREAVSSK